MMGSQTSSHRELVACALADVDLEARLVNFPALADAYRDVDLRNHSATPPYYCHHLAWRLATLSRPLLMRFDELLAIAADLPGWETERKSLIRDPEFAVFWSLIWQLQVAEFLVRRDLSVRWTGAGPDLQAESTSGVFYVECVALRKSFGVRLFIEELLHSIHPRLQVTHQPFLRFGVPLNAELDSFLDELFSPFRDPSFLPDLLAQAEVSYPVLLKVPESAKNLTIYLEGENLDRYVPGRIAQGGGCQAEHLTTMLSEAVSSKAHSNRLSEHRPNVLAVNLALGEDQELAIKLGAEPRVSLSGAVDEVVYGAVGIDRVLRGEDLFRIDRSVEGVSTGWWPGRAAA